MEYDLWRPNYSLAVSGTCGSSPDSPAAGCIIGGHTSERGQRLRLALFRLYPDPHRRRARRRPRTRWEAVMSSNSGGGAVLLPGGGPWSAGCGPVVQCQIYPEPRPAGRGGRSCGDLVGAKPPQPPNRRYRRASRTPPPRTVGQSVLPSWSTGEAEIGQARVHIARAGR
jgi:hypothetical protein